MSVKQQRRNRILSAYLHPSLQSMLPKQCVRKCSSHRSSPRRQTYSSLSRYQRSLRYRMEDIQPSPSISVSDEQQQQQQQQRSSHLGLANANSCELNGLASRGEQQTRETGGREYARSMSRGSDTSQLTMMTSISKQGLNEGNNNVAANECLLRIHRSSKAVTSGNVCLRSDNHVGGCYPHNCVRHGLTPIAPRVSLYLSVVFTKLIGESSGKDKGRMSFLLPVSARVYLCAKCYIPLARLSIARRRPRGKIYRIRVSGTRRNESRCESGKFIPRR